MMPDQSVPTKRTCRESSAIVAPNHHQPMQDKMNNNDNLNSSMQQLCVLPYQHHAHHQSSDILTLSRRQDISQTSFIARFNRKTNESTRQQQTRQQMISASHPKNDPNADVDLVRSLRPALGQNVEPPSTDLTGAQSTHFAKSIHVEEEASAKSAWDLKSSANSYDLSDSESGSDDDEHEDDDDVYDLYDHHKKGMKKNKKKGAKKMYVKKTYPGKRKRRKRKRKYHKHHHHHDDDYHHKYAKKPKKVLYKAHVVYKDEPKRHHKYHHDDDDKDHDSHHYYVATGKSKTGGGGGVKMKLIVLDGVQKHGLHHNHHHHQGKYATNSMRLAGLLGYTLMCVNYLLVARQPTSHDFHHHNHYASYSPHSGVKSGGGPIILAHCSKLKSPPVDGQLLAAASAVLLQSNSSSVYANQDKQQSMKAETSSSEGLEKRPLAAATTDLYYSLFSAHSGQQQSPLLAAARSPPAFFYTLAPAARQQQHPAAGQRLAANEFGQFAVSPIQDYLNRILLPTDRQQQQQEPALAGLPSPRDNLRLFSTGQADGQAVLGQRVNRIRPASQRLVLLDGSGGGGQPQVVDTRDNLAGLRARQTDIAVRVTERRHFVGPQQSMRLIRQGETLASPDSNDDDADGVGRMQADQPTTEGTNNSSSSSGNNNNGLSSPSNNLVLDLPEFALAGDSIQLTCNHRIAQQRLYSVKWFKDSFEFYRFIPANGPRSKSALFLPEIRLDLARSNADSLFLRNVTHRSSGLYRCEAVSEGPNFDLVSGERRMQVYALPESGPRMSLVERAELPPASTPPPLLPLVAGPADTPTSTPTGREQNDNDDNDNIDNDDIGGGNADRLDSTGRQLSAEPRRQRQRILSGPIVRCQSARASPAAQLRLFINDRALELDRTIENSTASYSDGLESNMVAFRISLDDFRVATAATTEAPLDKAAAGSRKLNASLSGEKSTMTTTTRASTSPTPRPTKLASALSASSDAERKQQRPATANANANANVVFDDDSKSDRAAANQKRPLKSARKQASSKRRKDQVTSRQQNLADPAEANNDDDDDDDAAAAADPADRHQHEAAAASLQADLVRLPVGKDKPPAAPAPLESLGGMEQRTNLRTRQPPPASPASYSNYIRVKCTSLVPAVGYEMTSELSVPLTLLVPARQLLAGGAGAEWRAAAGSGPGEVQAGGAGSLQAPRAVLIDRLAQASDPNARLSKTTANSSAGSGGHRRLSTPAAHQMSQQQVLFGERARKGQPAAPVGSQRLANQPGRPQAAR